MGANATVLPNITIGSNVIIGAGAVVTSDLPDNCTASWRASKNNKVMRNICIIPARGGSKRIPKKNIKTFLGKANYCLLNRCSNKL